MEAPPTPSRHRVARHHDTIDHARRLQLGARRMPRREVEIEQSGERASQAERHQPGPRRLAPVHREHAGARLPPHQPEPRQIDQRSEEHTSELQSLMRISYAVLCLKHKNESNFYHHITTVYSNHEN